MINVYELHEIAVKIFSWQTEWRVKFEVEWGWDEHVNLEQVGEIIVKKVVQV